MHVCTIGRRFTQMIAYFLVMNSKRCIPLALVEYELAITIFIKRKWNNCFIKNSYKHLQGSTHSTEDEKREIPLLFPFLPILYPFRRPLSMLVFACDLYSSCNGLIFRQMTLLD